MFSLTIHEKENKKLKLKLTDYQIFTNSGLLSIFLSYTYDSVQQMVEFCDKFGFHNSSAFIKTHYKKNGQACAAFTKRLQEVEVETAGVVTEAQEKIEAIGRSIVVDQLQTLSEKINNQSAEVRTKLEEQTRENKSARDALNLEIAEQEAAAQALLDQVIISARKSTESNIQALLKQSSETGAIAIAKKKQAEANENLERMRRILAESDSYFEEIRRVILLLARFHLYVDDEIAKKGKWCNRVRWQAFVKLLKDTADEDFSFMNSSNRLKMFCMLMYHLLIASLITIFLAYAISLPFMIALPLHAPLGALVGIFSISLPLAMIIVGLGFVALTLKYLDEGRGKEKFEKHTLSSSFSHHLGDMFDEIKEKIHDIQIVNGVIDLKETITHPFLVLNKKESNVQDIRKAIYSELTFFKHLYAQSPRDQEQLNNQEEKSLTA
ncbi:MAG: hypothetical protein H0U75_08005 [Legionella sp.]|nr:hypothetical protein [Legionella sp.]